MKAVEAIRNHPLYVQSYERIQKWEKNRIFCRHNMEHFLDVARIAWIMNLEQNEGLRKETVYAAALLHDIGRWMQYERGIPHDTASAEIAEKILEEQPETCFTAEEKQEILRAIRGHRRQEAGAGGLEAVLYSSDKKSRTCFACPAEAKCNWSREKKNMEIEI